MTDQNSTGAGVEAPEARYRIAFILVTSLFFMWAIAHNMNDILIRQFQKSLELSRGQASFIQVAFYLAYAFLSIPIGYILDRFGFKISIILGLGLYATGALMFFPASETRAYEMFLVALFIIASGIIFLETAGSGFIALTGNPATSVQRLNFAQAFNGLGSVIAPLIGGLLVFSGVEHSDAQFAAMSAAEQAAYLSGEAKRVQAPYLGIAAATTILLALVWLAKFPADSQATQPGARNLRRLFSHASFRAAIVAQFFYVGAQIAVWSYFIDCVRELTPSISEKTAAYLLSGSLMAFMLGRFLSVALMRKISPTRLLFLYAAACAALCVVVMLGLGSLSVAALVGVSAFMSIMFPTIYALGLRDLGDQARFGSSFIIMTIVGGAFFPPALGYLSDIVPVHVAYGVPLIAFLVVLQFARSAGQVPRSA